MNVSPLDIAVFAFYMLVLIGVGVWFTRRQKGLKSYLLADQDVHWVIVAVSVLAALFSGITYLGAPAWSFFHDLGYLWVIASFFIATPITTLVFLPFFRGLNLYTAYEYLEKRFDRRLCWLASALFIGRVSLYLGLVIYAPALAIEQITGLPFETSVVLTGVAATGYTMLGGMKAVIWTDSLQFLVLCGGVVLVLGFAASRVPGGLPAAWQAAAADGKTRFLHFELSPWIHRDRATGYEFGRMTLWAAVLGGVCNNLVQMVTDQIAVQRYLTAPSLKDSQRALWFKLWVTLPLVAMFYLTGTVLYGFYRTFPDKVPAFQGAALVPKLAQPAPAAGATPLKADYLLPYFVVHELPPPLPGLLIAAVFGATMAVVSAGVNSLATTALMDFRRKPREVQGSERHQLLIARVLTVFFGLLATVLALFVLARVKTLMAATNIIMGLFGGPLLGIFFLGAFSRRANGSGALIGAAAGALTGLVVHFSGSWSKLAGCASTSTGPGYELVRATAGLLDRVFPAEVSFLWISFCSTVVTFVLGLAGSLLFPAPGPAVEAFVFGGRAIKKA